MRYSSRREAIIGVMRQTNCHPDAEWVYNKVRLNMPNISLGTVYRNLKELSAAGKLSTLETEFGSLHFDYDTSPHAHFVCSECGSISDLYDCAIDTDKLRDCGYAVKSVKTVVYGICPHCVENSRAEKSEENLIS